MWKKSNKIKKVKLKYQDDYSIEELAKDLKTLNDIEVLDYQVKGRNDFSVAFNKNFVDYYNKNHSRLQESALQNMAGALKQYPEEKPSIDNFVTMFYSTVILSYLNETGLIRKIDVSDIKTIGRLIVTIEDLEELMKESTAEEEKTKK